MYILVYRRHVELTGQTHFHPTEIFDHALFRFEQQDEINSISFPLRYNVYHFCICHKHIT